MQTTSLSNQLPDQHAPRATVGALSNDILFRKLYWLQLGTILVIAALTYLCFALNWTKFSRAEVFFAECAREMLEQQNYVTPLYHGQPFFDKPILIYWLIIAVFKGIGISHLAARIPSIIAALVTVTVSGASAALIYKNARAGLIAAMALASSFMFLSFAYLCMSDMMLVMFDTMTMALLYWGLIREKHRGFLWWIASISLGLAFLTKGPVGVGLPVMSFLLFLLATRQLFILKVRHLIVFAITAFIVASPWFIATYNANGISALTYFFIRENLERFAGSTYDTHKPFWFMVVSLMSGFLPWSIFLPFALAKYVARRPIRSEETYGFREKQNQLYLWLWIAVVVGFFSFSRGKCDYYVLPAYPAAAILVGGYLSQLIEANSKAAKMTSLFIAGLFFIAGLASFVVLPKVLGEGDVWQWAMVPCALLVPVSLMLWALLKRRVFLAYALVFCGICWTGAALATQVLPVIVRQQPVVAYVKVIQQSPVTAQLAVDRSLNHWIDEITFQSGREPIRIDSIEQLTSLLGDNRPVLAILPEQALREVFEHNPELKSVVRIIDKRETISHALTPAYVFKRHSHIKDVVTVLISNKAN